MKADVISAISDFLLKKIAWTQVLDCLEAMEDENERVMKLKDDIPPEFVRKENETYHKLVASLQQKTKLSRELRALSSPDTAAEQIKTALDSFVELKKTIEEVNARIVKFLNS